jgi:hypothetical protein
MVAKRHPSACVHHHSGAWGPGIARLKGSIVEPGGPGKGQVGVWFADYESGRKPARGGRADTQRSRLLPADWPVSLTGPYRPKPMARSRLPAGVTAQWTAYGGIRRKNPAEATELQPKVALVATAVVQSTPISTTPHGDGRTEGVDQGGSPVKGNGFLFGGTPWGTEKRKGAPA